jgi:hypothetical protein
VGKDMSVSSAAGNYHEFKSVTQRHDASHPGSRRVPVSVWYSYCIVSPAPNVYNRRTPDCE